ncbi:MAG: hypothetical protein ACRDUV_10680 [Pseudonocardiaceae bacterium]
MDEYDVFVLPAPVRATDGTCHGHSADLCHSFIYETRRLMTAEKSHEVLVHGAKPPGLGGRAMTTPPAPVLPDPEVTRLQRVLEDVRFSLERGYWQAALAATRAALARDEATKR